MKTQYLRVYPKINVRVFDYGGLGTIWLSITEKAWKSGGNISIAFSLGFVMLDRNSSFGLREKTNREGFIER